MKSRSSFTRKFQRRGYLLLYLKITDMNPKSNLVQLHYYRPSSFISKGEYFKEGAIKFQENTIHSIEAQCFYDTGNCPYPWNKHKSPPIRGKVIKLNT